MPSSDFFQDKDTFILIVQDSMLYWLYAYRTYNPVELGSFYFVKAATLQKDFDLVVCF